MKKLFILFFLLISVCSFAQRQMENLDRGLIAQKVTGKGMYVNWRITGQEWYGTSYNLYRDGILVNTTPITGASNYTDATGTPESVYTVTSIKNGVESAKSKPALILTNNYLNIKLRDLPGGYAPNDATMADLDGDGEMEILVKRIYADWAINVTYYSYIEAYKLNGDFMWAINVGPNITDDVEINVAAFDFDGDGKAEVFLRTSEGTIFGLDINGNGGVAIGDTNSDGKTNYRLGGQYMIEGPEFLSLVDGETGKELDRVDYIPRTFGGKTVEEIWGDGYGHRCSKYFFGAPYLDGKKPSLFISRGIYTRIVMRTYDVVNKKLVFKWEFNTDNNPAYAYQGNHNYTIADADGDGCDEIIYGSMTVDHTGKGLYSTELGHGDAIHVGDFDPFHKGIEVWACHENVTGISFREAKTGKMLIRRATGKDTGRCMAANVTNDYLGAALGGVDPLFSATTREAVTDKGGLTNNFRIYWDGDLLEEGFNYDAFSESTGGGEGTIWKYNQSGALFKTSGALTNNWTKGTPCLQADIFGDWREEFIMRSADNKNLRIYSTSTPTGHRIYTLLHDMQYRQAICWQMCGYNQPPHVSYFLGDLEGITLPPPPVMNNDRLVYNGTGAWDGANWTKNKETASYANGTSVLLDADAGGTITLTGAVSPELLTVNSIGNHTLQGGSFTGAMHLNKQGTGTLTLSSDLLYTGPTELWDGLTVITSNVQQSPVWMNRFAELNLKADAQKGIIQEYGSILRLGNNNEKNTVTISDSLYLKWGAQVDFDVYDSDFSTDLLKINGNLILTKEAVFNIIPHISGTTIKPGKYLLAEVSGTIKGNLYELVISGLDGVACALSTEDNKIYLNVDDIRTATSVIWKGANNNGEWNLASTKNFLNGENEDIFVTGDNVIMDNTATKRVVNLTSNVSPASLLIDNTSAYTIMGTKSVKGIAKSIIGQMSFTKKGTGTLTISNANSFSGKIEILDGIVAVNTLANTTITDGSLGVVRTKASDFVINGGTLKPNGSLITSSSPMTIGENGATFNASSDIIIEGAISGTGKLIKTGASTLSLNSPNSYTGGTEVKAGTLYMSASNATFGKVGSPLLLSGGTVQVLDNSGLYGINFNYAVEVPSGATATLRAGSRSTINGTYTGSGTLNLYVPYVRADIGGNWSGFTGKLNVTGSQYRFSTSLDMSGTTLVLGELTMGHFQAGSGNASSGTTKIGALSSTFPTATVTNGTYNVGYTNTNASFAGVLDGVTINKYGTGNWTLTGKSSATINIHAGKVIANATTTTTGAITVNSGGTLAGSGAVKNVTVNSGGTLEPAANTSAIGTFTVGGALTMKGKLSFKRNATRNDNLVVTGNTTLTDAIIEINASNELSVGDELKILTVSGKITGTFTMSPAAPGEGLSWDTSRLLSEGILSVTESTGLHTVGVNGPKIYPTAVTDICHVDVSNACRGKVQMELYNAEGKVILKRTFDAAEVQDINLSTNPSGIYFLILKAGNEKIQQTITKL